MTTVAEMLKEATPEQRRLFLRRLQARSTGDGKEGEAPSAPRPRSRETSPPLSFGQQRLWFLERFAPEARTYNLSMVLEAHGTLSVPVLRAAVDEIVRRHEVLRTVVGSDPETREPMQQVLPRGQIDLPVVDLDGLDGERKHRESRRLEASRALAPYDLRRGPLVRLQLVRLGASSHRLHVAMHHFVTDGWSFDVLVRELGTLYRSFAEGERSPLPELPVQYADFACWQREFLTGDALDRLLDFWRRELAGAPALLELPTDRPRTAAQSFRVGIRGRELPTALSAGIVESSRRHGASSFMILLSSLTAFLHRYTGRDDLIIGTPVAGRNHASLEQLIGFFLNMLVLRHQISGDPELGTLLGQIRDVVSRAYAHQEMPFERLVDELGVERSLSHSPVFQVMLNVMHAESPTLEIPGGEIRFPERRAQPPAGDLDLYAVQTAQSLFLEARYDTDLFDATTIERWLRHYVRILQTLTEAPATPLSRLDLLSPAERHTLCREWNDTAGESPGDGLFHDHFAARARSCPDAVALVSDGISLSYGELEARAELLARHLVKLGITPEARVGVALERSAQLVIAVLAVLKSGGAYVPLDPSYPRQRLGIMIEDALASQDVAIVLTREGLAGDLAALDPTLQLVALDRDRREIAAAGIDPGRVAPHPEQLAYVIFTSGSTGRPKGVPISHRALLNFLESMARRPGLDARDTLLSVTTLSFDISCLELYLPLMCGARLEIAGQDEASDGRRLARRLAACGATFMQATPATWQLLRHSGWQGDGRLRVLSGGEALPAELARHLEARSGEVWNVYGPTETTVWSSIYRVATRRDPVPLGRAIRNTSILVVDRRGEPVPLGVRGELRIGGAGLSRGYLGRPALAAERFVPHPASPQAGARIYCTGDLASLSADGVLEFKGRRDHQVKVRGFRIELAEIESVLEACPGVDRAVVAVRGDLVGGEKVLVAWVAGPAPPEEGILRRRLADALPAYMTAAHFELLEKIPLTPNGKVDRRALPAPQLRRPAPEGRRGPQNPIEASLLALCRNLFPGREVAIEDSFFALGGNSINAMRLVTEIEDRLAVDVPLITVFQTSSLADLARAIQEHQETGATGASRAPRRIEPGSRETPPPLSFGQQRLWFLEQFAPQARTYNMSVVLAARGGLHVPTLRRAAAEIVRRHESLRTLLAVDPESREPVQVILPEGSADVPLVDLRGLEPGRRRREGTRLEQRRAEELYDLSRGPLLRLMLVRFEAERFELQIAMHHIVTDAWSFDIFIRELGELYRAFSRGEPSPLTDLPVQYADFSAWQRARLEGDVLRRLLDFWREELAEAPRLLELPTDRPRLAAESSRGGVRRCALPPELATEVEVLGRRAGASLFMILMTCYVVLLHRYTGSTDIAVGTPIASRDRAELEGLIGFLLNMLVLRHDISGDPSLGETLELVLETASRAYAHKELPFERLVDELQVERSLVHAPLFQVMLNVTYPRDRSVELPGLELQLAESRPQPPISDFDLDAVRAAGGLYLEVRYNADLFDATTVGRWLGHYLHIVEALIGAPETPLSRLDMLSPAEHHAVLEWNDTAGELPLEAVPHRRFEGVALEAPDAAAVTHGSSFVSYGELSSRADRLARHLVGLGVAPEVRVGVAVERSVELVVAVLGVLRSGGAYVPLDPAYPARRLELMVQDGLSGQEVAIVLTQERFAADLSQLDPELKIVCLDRDWEETDEVEAQALPAAAPQADQLAYVIFTSGSTGRPKGVQISHGALLNFLDSMARRPGLEKGETVLAVTSLSFDISGLELYLPLLRGGRVDIARSDAVGDGRRLAERLEACQADVLQATPATWQVLRHSGWQGAPWLRALCGGEAFPAELAKWLDARVQEVWNVYGPTETTVWSSVHRVREQQDPIPLGRPVLNTEILIVDRLGERAPTGGVGELQIGGAGLSRGYLGRSALTAEKLVPHPWSPVAGARLYRTGDLAALDAHGVPQFKGRLDHQVKIRGYRIELGEVESALSAFPGVDQAVVSARADVLRDEPALVGYVEGLDPQEEPELRRQLGQVLPAYMMPTHLVFLDSFPLTPNGKVDRRALPAPVFETAPGEQEPAMANPIEALLLELCGAIFPGRSVHLGDNFFALGGTSISAVRLAADIRDSFGIELPLISIFQAANLADLATAILQLEAELQEDAELEAVLAELEDLSEEDVLSSLAGEGQE